MLAILLVQPSASGQTLANRYSFSEPNGSTNVADSVGGPAWDGTVMQQFTNAVGGLFTGSQLVLQASGLQFVQLPAGILSNYTAVTIDVWATFGSLPANCFLFGFGDTDTSGAGQNYIFCQPQNGRIAITGVDPGWQGEQGTGGAGDLSGQTVHVTSVFNPPAGVLELYANGVLVSRNTSITVPMSSVSNVLNYIARSLYTADSYFDVSLDEFRIWNGALNGLQVAASGMARSTVCKSPLAMSPGRIPSAPTTVP
jgi:hypothetical protein